MQTRQIVAPHRLRSAHAAATLAAAAALALCLLLPLPAATAQTAGGDAASPNPPQPRQQSRADSHDIHERTDRQVLSAIGRIVHPMIRNEAAVGLAVGIVTPDGTAHTQTFGVHEAVRPGITFDDLRPVNAQSIFEIGSVTKLFTALLLIDAAERGEVALDDPVNDYLPDDVRLGPNLSGDPVTLRQLAQHTSGLPRLPSNMGERAQSILQPYATYTTDELYDAVRGFTRYESDDDDQAGDPGQSETTATDQPWETPYLYSNLGAALLGQALANATGEPYETLVVERIAQPLGLESTVFDLDPDQLRRATSPHYLDFKPIRMWEFQAIAPAGALRSDLDDMMDFVQAFLEPSDIAPGDETSPLERAIAGMLRAPRVRIDQAGNQGIGLGWHAAQAPALGGELLWHNGQTGGSKSYVALMPEFGAAVVVLANYPDPAVDIVGPLLLNYAVTGEIRPTPVREVQRLNAAQVEPLAGVYQFEDGRTITITTEGARVFARIGEQDNFRIYPAQPRLFFYKVVPAEVAFIFDPETNLARELVFMQNNAQMTARRIGDAPQERTDSGSKPADGPDDQDE